MSLKRFFWSSQKRTLIFLLCTICILSQCSENKEESAGSSFLREITDEVHLDFLHDPAVDGSYYMPESIGSGGAFLDYDNDGDLDIYLVNCASHNSRKKETTPLRNQLFRQETDGSFLNVTAGSGLGDTGYGMGVAVGDYDNDGFVDVYISNEGPDALYHNNGNGTFTDVTQESGINNPDWGISVVFTDYNRDCYLDIFVANYVDYDTSVYCSDRVGGRDYCGPQGFAGYADRLFKNNGNGTFTDVSLISGIASKKSAGLGVTSVDFNDDMFPDIYVANDREQNHLWMNQGDGTFKDQAVMLGVGYNGSGMAEGSMGIAVGNVDGDDDIDLFVSHFMNESNTLYRNMGEFGFQDDTGPAALVIPSLPYTGFGTGFFDYDQDGDLDLAVANGRVIRATLLTGQKAPGYWDYYAEPNLVFENDGTGIFKNSSASFSEFTARIENSRGLVFGDIDNDGDIDILVTNEGGRARLYRNVFVHPGNWLIVQAVDPEMNRVAYGAKLRVKAGKKTLLRLVNPGYSFCSSNDPRVHFGLGSYSGDVSINIEWPDGSKEDIAAVPLNQIVTIMKGIGIVAKKS
jgi:enediyne biosynthesis protein E4